MLLPNLGGHVASGPQASDNDRAIPLDVTANPMIVSFAQIRASLYVMSAAVALGALAPAPARAQAEAPVELAAAQAAVERATQADADQYASDTVDSARQLLRQSQLAQANRDRRSAVQLALQAAAEADLARARSEQAVVEANLSQRQQEVAALKRKLGLEGGQ